MYLINVRTYELEWFVDEKQVPGGYAILSHRWEDEEILYKDITKAKMRAQMCRLKGFYKFNKTCQQAFQDGLSYAWIDTCCIDKSSSAELQEAINSMFRWYKHAQRCYAYLSDVDDDCYMGLGVANSKWFSRGWTLQELLAPVVLIFYSATWTEVMDRSFWAEEITRTTNIPTELLRSSWSLAEFHPCAAEILSWASKRSTTRVEDESYCLIGLFEINMPLLYGEGTKAFARLQHEILRQSDDQSLFAWEIPRDITHVSSLLAPSPHSFGLLRALNYGRMTHALSWKRRQAHNVDSEGVSAEVNLLCFAPRMYLAVLNSQIELKSISPTSSLEGRIRRLAIVVKRLDTYGRFSRVCTNLNSAIWDWTKREKMNVKIEGGVSIVEEHFEDMLQVIKVVHNPRFAESQILKTEYCAAVKMEIPGVSMSGNTLIFKPMYELQDNFIRLTTPVADSWGLASIIACKTPIYDGDWLSQSWDCWPRIHYIGVGFDSHFNPLLAFVLDSHLEWRKAHTLLLTEILSVSLDERMREFSRDNFVEDKGSMARHYLPTSYVTGRGILFKQYDNECLLLKLQLSAADERGGSARIFDCMSSGPTHKFRLNVGILRSKPDQPWQVRIEQHKRE